MPLEVASVAAATAVVGYDLLTNYPAMRQSGAPRTLDEAALTGSAAAGDTEISLRIGNVQVVRIFNTATGFPTQDASKIQLPGYFIPAGEPLSAIVLDAPTSNPINLQLGTTELIG